MILNLPMNSSELSLQRIGLKQVGDVGHFFGRAQDRLFVTFAVYGLLQRQRRTAYFGRRRVGRCRTIFLGRAATIEREKRAGRLYIGESLIFKKGMRQRIARLLQRDELSLCFHESGRELQTSQTGQLAGFLLIERLLRVGALEGRAEHARDRFFDFVRRVLAEAEGATHSTVYDSSVAFHSVEFLGAARFVQIDLQLFGLDSAKNVFLFFLDFV